jgi:aspartyl-tRNA(Asn)/glutamyl-tRNA(Gln) amidotransferase subunit B
MSSVGAGGELEAVIGLEIHVQLATASKIFCGCSTRFGAPPNSQVCPVCSGQPGVLPVLNASAVEHALRLGLALGCRVRARSRFARKNYFYPDLPKGYQISQYEEPLAEGGAVEIELEGARRRVRLTRIHLEEDAGKSLHEGAASRVDLNRAGVPLVEIVSEPDLTSPAEAAELMRTLRAIVRALGVGDGNMEQGSLRCDANVSLRPRGASALGVKTEVKNINSFRFVQRALEHELERQRALLARGEAVVQETRLWDSERGVTESMRSKEEAHDYRYFPEPDLPPLAIDEGWLARLRAGLPELPLARRDRLAREHDLPAQGAAGLTRERELADYFERAVAAGARPRPAASFILTELLGRVPDAREVAAAPVTPEALAGLDALVASGRVSGKLAKEIFARMWESGRSAEEIAREGDLYQSSDAAAIEAEVRRVVAASPAQVAEYRAGKEKVLGFFVGQVMRATAGRANPALVNELVRKHLGLGSEETR